MKNTRTLRAKDTCLLLLLLLLPMLTFAQRPEVTAISKISGGMEEVVLLKGSSFGTDATKLVVFFGAQRAVIKSVTNQLLEVRVPAGTTYDNISVTNVTNNLTGYSRPQFLISYGGTHPFDASKLGTQQNFTAGNELYDHCLCDFDNDGKVDIATANRSSTSISILQNTSTGAGNINFNTTQKSITASSLQIKCGDLNGDGRPDLVVTEGTKLVSDTRIFILQNNGGLSFTNQIISLTSQKTSKIDIADLDLDGKPEVLVTDQANGKVVVLPNQSTGSIAFGAPITLTVAGAASTDGIAVKDMNGDELPDIVTSQFGTAPSNLYVAVNNSIPGSINISAFTKIDLDDAVRDIHVADIDNDRKADVIGSKFLTGQLVIFQNTSTGSAITFSRKPEIAAQPAVWGFDVGDLDGDGRVDIVTSSVSNTKLSILTNDSNGGTISFISSEVTTQFITRHIRIGDLDGDGKPDISFCSVDKSGIPASKISVFRNQSCVTPVVYPIKTPIQLCSGALPYRLTATASAGAFYQWLKDGVPVSCGVNQYTFDVTAGTGSGKYSVKILAEGATCSSSGSCEIESNAVDIVIGAATSTLVGPKNNGPVCLTGTLNLSLTSNVGDSYKWTGPEGFTATGPTATLSNFQLANAGQYEVEVTKGGCIASRETTTVEAIDVPSFVIGYSGSKTLCQGDPAKTLTVVPAPGSFTYEWFKDGNSVGTGSTYSVASLASAIGNYTVKASYAGCATIESPAVDINVVAPPVATITAPTSACQGEQVSFAAASNSGTPTYAWDFGDGKTSTEQNPKKIYDAPNAGYNVKLTVSYDGACAQVANHTIAITAAPVMTITTTAADYNICEGETIDLSIANTFTDPVWSTGAQTFTVNVGDEGKYSVTAKASNGCVLTAESQKVLVIPAPDMILTADPPKINEGQSSQLNATGLLSYSWIPAESLNDADIANPIATPIATTSYTVTGPGENGCPGTATIQVTVQGEAIVNKLDPKNFFSPNNSGPNDLWLVDNIQDYPQCGVTIYDDKGVKVYSAKPYNNDWNGTYNGKDLPDGVYYFVIRCDGEENSPRTGHITIIR